MKKLVLIVGVLLSSVTLFGQTTQGKFALSGATGLQFANSNIKYVYDGETSFKVTQNTFSFLPSFAYFVVDNLAIGLSSSISMTTFKDEDGDKELTSSSLIMPTAIFYFPSGGEIRPFLQAAAGYSSTVNKYIPKNGKNDTDSQDGFAFNLGGGLSYFVKESIAFNLGLSYTKSTLTDNDDNKSKIKQGSFGSNIGISVFF